MDRVSSAGVAGRWKASERCALLCRTAGHVAAWWRAAVLWGRQGLVARASRRAQTRLLARVRSGGLCSLCCCNAIALTGVAPACCGGRSGFFAVKMARMRGASDPSAPCEWLCSELHGSVTPSLLVCHANPLPLVWQLSHTLLPWQGIRAVWGDARCCITRQARRPHAHVSSSKCLPSRWLAVAHLPITRHMCSSLHITDDALRRRRSRHPCCPCGVVRDGDAYGQRRSADL